MEVETTNAIKSLSEQALRDLYSNLTQAKGFVLDQAPEFCQQLITRDIMVYASSAVLCGLCAILCLYVFLCCLWSDDDCTKVMGGTFSGVACVVLFAVVCTNAITALSIYIAPKVYLVEQLARMLK